MGSPVREELEILYHYAQGCKFIIETGGGGKSTQWLAKAARLNNALMVSIEADKSHIREVKGVVVMQGWSVAFEDVVKKGDPLFVKSRYPNQIDEKVAMGNRKAMRGETDLIRKVLAKYNRPLDFFFCDTGEYCGIAEWRIVKDVIVSGGYFVAHDIYYPKSSKNFQVVKMIEEDPKWVMLEKTMSRQGLLVSMKK